MQSSESPPAYLLVRRPATGLLAGLWEFPTVPVASDASKSARQNVVDTLLARLVAGEFDILERVEVGEYVHIFSHIRQMMLVERMVITKLNGGKRNKRQKGGETSPETSGSKGTVPQVRWVPEEEMTTVGLTSGVRKVRNVTG